MPLTELIPSWQREISNFSSPQEGQQFLFEKKALKFHIGIAWILGIKGNIPFSPKHEKKIPERV